jgi:hypothetical protein
MTKNRLHIFFKGIPVIVLSSPLHSLRTLSNAPQHIRFGWDYVFHWTFFLSFLWFLNKVQKL